MMNTASDARKNTRAGCEEFCPYLGLYHDPGTCFSGPNIENYCWRLRKPCPVRRSHQREFCLTARYSRCPVFRSRRTARFPAELRGQGVVEVGRKGIFRWVLLGMLCMLLAVNGIWWWTRPARQSSRVQSVPRSSQSPTHSRQEETDPDQFSPTSPRETQPLPTSSLPGIDPQTHTPTQPMTPGPGVGTPFGSVQLFVLYRVEQGDSLGDLTRRYSTSVEAIRQASNIMEGKDIWPGDLIVIPIGSTNLSAIPPFKPLYLERDTNIHDIAKLYGISADLIRLYNDLGDGEMIPAARWLIVPLEEKN